jgi:hypothetical protein
VHPEQIYGLGWRSRTGMRRCNRELHIASLMRVMPVTSSAAATRTSGLMDRSASCFTQRIPGG